MKISNEGIYKTCPMCDGRQELYRYYTEGYWEDDDDLLEDYWCCHRCGFTEYRSEVNRHEV